MDPLAGLTTCTRCDLAQTRQRVVIGSGPSAPRLVIVGEAPGATEDEGGEPFIGRSGQLLFRLLGEVGLTRAHCFVTNVVKCRPPANRTPRSGEVTACAPWLDAQFAMLSAAPVLALGALAARRVFDLDDTMAHVHGRIQRRGTLTGLATYHPAAALRARHALAALRDDLVTVAALVDP